MEDTHIINLFLERSEDAIRQVEVKYEKFCFKIAWNILYNTEDSEECVNDNDDKIKKLVKEFLKLENPTPELMKVLINRIEIHQDKQVDLVFNFKILNKIEQFQNAE